MPRNKRKHPAVRVCHNGVVALIDVLIAPLILAMWVAGIRTSMSCQGAPEGYIWIEFEDAAYLISFLNIISNEDRYHDKVRGRMSSPSRAVVGRHEWLYHLAVGDLARELIDPKDVDARRFVYPEFTADVSVRFPDTDLPLVLRYMKRHNARCKRSKSIPNEAA